MTTIDRLQNVMRAVFLDPHLCVNAQTTALDVDGWDSLSHSMLMLEIEQAFGVELDLAAAGRCRNLGELAACIDERVAA